MPKQSVSPQTGKEKKRLLSYRAWIMILVLAFIATISHPIPGAGPNYMAGVFVGSVLSCAVLWALITLLYRWISRHFRKAT